jgi:hypothetical protein
MDNVVLVSGIKDKNYDSRKMINCNCACDEMVVIVCTVEIGYERKK